MSTINLTKQNFEKYLKANDIILLDFWASWCGPCKNFGPIFEKVSNKHPDIVFGKIDTEAEQELAAQFGIRSIPTVMAFRQSIAIFEQPGLLPEEALEDIIKQIRQLNMDEVRKQISEQEKQ
jgi:thioredoxin 1